MNQQHIELFSNGEFELQVTPVGDSFIVEAPGLARALSFAKARDMVRSLPNDEKGCALARTPGGNQEIWHVTEPGLYRVLGQRQASRIKDPAMKLQVERFQRWLFHEVLPALRKNGSHVIPSQRFETDEFHQPHTLTWDEVCALLRQRYGMPFTVNQFTRTLRSGGVLKQNGSPRKEWAHLFWFTGSSWNVHPHMVAQLAKKAIDTDQAIQGMRFLQTQLEIEGVGSPALLDTRDRRGRGIEVTRPKDGRP